MQVAQIAKDQVDDTGEQVTNVYAKNSPFYAVYQTRDRVRIHYADDSDLTKTQRGSIAQLNPIRSEINGLIDGWRLSKNSNAIKKAAYYSLRVSDGLIVALEDDAAGAVAILTKVKQDILDERTSKARFEYLAVASFGVFLVLAIAYAITLAITETRVANIWIAAAAGAVGAFFSIAIGIRSRTVLTDIFFRDNSSDAILRVVIGLIAGAFVVCCIESRLVTFIVDGGRFDDALGNKTQWLFVLILGFAAGFSERLVPDLLAKSFSTAKADASAPAPAAAKADAAAAATAGASVAATAASAAASPSEAPTPLAPSLQTPDDESDTDSCLCHAGVQDDEATADADLPPAIGGVAGARA